MVTPDGGGEIGEVEVEVEEEATGNDSLAVVGLLRSSSVGVVSPQRETFSKLSTCTKFPSKQGRHDSEAARGPNT